MIENILFKFINFRYLILSSNVLPKYGLLAEYSLDGKLIKNWADPTGKVVQVTTNAIIYDKKLYMGSYYNDFIAYVDY